MIYPTARARYGFAPNWQVKGALNIGCCCVIIHTGASALWRGQQHIWIQRKTRRQHSRPLSSALSIPLLFPILACNAFYNPHCALFVQTESCWIFHLVCFLHCSLLQTHGYLYADFAPPFNSVEIWFSEPLTALLSKQENSQQQKQKTILQLLKGLARHRFLGTGSLSAQKIGRGGQS